MKNIVTLIFFFLFLMSFSQNSNKKVKITGTIIDYNTGKPLEYATLVLQNTDNPSVVTGGITNHKGKFNITINQGNYNVLAEFISYNTYTKKNQKFYSSIDLGIIKLMPKIEQLEGVELIAEKTTVELRLDKKTYNVGKDLTLNGGSASDVLNNVPSVSVDAEGTISLRGNSNVKILINGKPSTLSGISPEALKQMPVNTIEKVEVITNPSSKYSSSGTAGILNIILRKNKKYGLNGSVTTSIRDPKSYNIGTNINLKRENFNIFSNLNYTDKERPGYSLFDNIFYDKSKNIVGTEDENRHFNNHSKNTNTILGIELFLDETSSLTNSISYSKTIGLSNTIIDLSSFDENKSPFLERNRNTLEDNTIENVQFSSNYKKVFNEEGHKINLDYQFSRGYEIEDRSITEFFKKDEGNSILGKAITDDIQISQLLQLDYALPFGKNFNSIIEIGYRGVFDDYNIDYLEGTITNDILIKDPKYSNKLHYSQSVNAAYLQFGQGFNNFNFSTGLRMENTNVTIDLKNSNTINNSTYTDWFPSMFLGYDFSTKEKMSINYTKRLSRPSAGSLNPFPNRVSKTNIYYGNPNLLPMYTHSYELNYLNKWKKTTFTASAYHTKTMNVINVVTVETGDFDTINDTNNPGNVINVPIIGKTKVNTTTENRLGIDATATYIPVKKWRLSLNVIAYKQSLDGSFSYIDFNEKTITKNLNIDQLRWFTTIRTKVPLPYNIGLQTNFFYVGADTNSQTKTKSLNRLDFALSRNFIKDKVSVTFGITDVFNNFKRYTETILPFSSSNNLLQTDLRYVKATIVYKFNQNK